MRSHQVWWLGAAWLALPLLAGAIVAAVMWGIQLQQVRTTGSRTIAVMIVNSDGPLWVTGMVWAALWLLPGLALLLLSRRFQTIGRL